MFSNLYVGEDCRFQITYVQRRPLVENGKLSIGWAKSQYQDATLRRGISALHGLNEMQDSCLTLVIFTQSSEIQACSMHAEFELMDFKPTLLCI